MQCGTCGTENASGRRFCGACGRPLSVPCRACGFADNTPADRFCGGCGTSLDHADPVNRGERRHVAILYADITGYTRMSRTQDPEETTAILDRFFARVDGAVARFGGRIDKHIGDNVMGVFGAPVAHTDDPERAVRAALAIHEAVAEVAREVGVPLTVHVGIAAGEVVATALGSAIHQQYTVTGDAVNLAARLQDVAKERQTVVSEVVARATDKVGRYTDLGPIDLKGIGVVRAFRLEGLVDAGTGTAPAIVGRDAELAQIDRALAAARAGAASRLHVRGEAGIGKSRLVAEALARAEAAGMARVRGRAVDFGSVGGRDALREVVTDLAAGRAVPPADVPFLADLLDQPQPDHWRDLYEQMDDRARQEGRARVLAGLLDGAGPGVVVFEDLHWAAPDVSSLVCGLRVPGWLVITTSRPDNDPTSCPPDETLSLGPLDPAAARELVRARGVSAQAADAWVARGGGNPFFLEQLAMSDPDGDPEAIPGTIRSLVLARVDRLPLADREALRAAAVLGSRASLTEVRSLLDDPSWTPDALIDRDLVELDGTSLAFRHALIRDGVYASLTRGRRRDLHHAAARISGEPARRAEHLEAADDPDAADTWREAGLLASERGHVEQARAMFERGYRVAAGAGDRHRLALALGRHLRLHGEVVACLDAYHLALDAAEAPLDRVRAYLGIGWGHRLRSEYQRSMDALDQAEALARQIDAPLELAEALYHRGSLLFATADEPGSRAAQTEALEHARRAGSAEMEARALSGLGDAAYLRGDLVETQERFAACVALCESAGLARYALPNRLMLAHTLHARGEMAAAEDQTHAAVAGARALGDRYVEMFALQSHSWLLLAIARYAEALEAAELALPICRAIGAKRFEVELLSGMAECHWGLGDPQAALPLAREAAGGSAEVGHEYIGRYCLALLAAITDDPEERARAIAEARAMTRHAALMHDGFGLRIAVEDGILRQDLTQIAEACDALDALPVKGATMFEYFARRGRAFAAWFRGERGPALDAELAALRETRASFLDRHLLPGE